MKKSLIAGAGVVAALGAVVAPFGAYAADTTSQKDTLTVTVSDLCSFGHDFTDASITDVAPGVHTDGTGTWGGAEGADVAVAGNETLTGTMENGTNTDNFGKTKLNVVCNNLYGWKVTATNTVLTGADTGQTIAQDASHSSTKSGWSWSVAADTPASGEAALTIPTGKQGAATDASVATVAEPTSVTGRSFTVTYGVGIQSNQAADTYTGTMTYTLAALDKPAGS